jgi:hypothetical protein
MSEDAASGGATQSGAFTRALQAASAKAAADHEKDVRDKLIKLHSEVYSGAAAYDNGVILAGYVAFFALWTGIHNDVSSLCRLVTVALMGASLICYMAWHIIQMLTRQRFEFKFAEVFKSATTDPTRFNREWNETAQKQEIATARLMRFWPFLFVPAVAFGFLGGGVLTYNALAVILGWPQLRG